MCSVRETHLPKNEEPDTLAFVRVLVVLEPQDPREAGSSEFRWSAEVPTVRGCSSWGPTLDEARENVREALAACLVAEHGIDGLALAEDAELVEVDADTFHEAIEVVQEALGAVDETLHDSTLLARELAARLCAEEEASEELVSEVFERWDFDFEKARKVAALLAEAE